MCEDWFNTFQAFYSYVKKTHFTLIRKSKRSIRIILNNESSEFTRTGLRELASSGQWWTCSSRSVPSTSSWLDSRRDSELENLKVMAGIGFLWSLSSMGRPMCVVRARSCLPERVEPQLLWCRKLPFAFSQHWSFHNFVWILHWRVVVVLPRLLHRNRQGIVRFGGLLPSQYLSVPRLLSLAHCCLSSTVIRELFVTFSVKASTRHSCFHHVANSVYARWLSFEPDVVIQSSVCFDTEVKRTRPSHV